jgi:hypothetical protein
MILEAHRQRICTLVLVLGVRTRRSGLRVIDPSDRNLEIIDNGGKSLIPIKHVYEDINN